MYNLMISKAFGCLPIIEYALCFQELKTSIVDILFEAFFWSITCSFQGWITIKNENQFVTYHMIHEPNK